VGGIERGGEHAGEEVGGDPGGGGQPGRVPEHHARGVQAELRDHLDDGGRGLLRRARPPPGERDEAAEGLGHRVVGLLQGVADHLGERRGDHASDLGGTGRGGSPPGFAVDPHPGGGELGGEEPRRRERRVRVPGRAVGTAGTHRERRHRHDVVPVDGPPVGGVPRPREQRVVDSERHGPLPHLVRHLDGEVRERGTAGAGADREEDVSPAHEGHGGPVPGGGGREHVGGTELLEGGGGGEQLEGGRRDAGRRRLDRAHRRPGGEVHEGDGERGGLGGEVVDGRLEVARGHRIGVDGDRRDRFRQRDHPGVRHRVGDDAAHGQGTGDGVLDVGGHVAAGEQQERGDHGTDGLHTLPLPSACPRVLHRLMWVVVIPSTRCCREVGSTWNSTSPSRSPRGIGTSTRSTT